MKPATNNYINFWNCALGDNSKFANLAKAVVEEQSAEIQELETQLAAKDAEFERKLAWHIKDREEAIAAKDAVIAKMREAFISVCCDPDGNVCVGTIGGTYADREILEEALREENDDSALQEALKQAKREGQAEMRERQVSLLRKNAHTFARNLVDEARALPIDGERLN